jgi:hypothetical protein
MESKHTVVPVLGGYERNNIMPTAFTIIAILLSSRLAVIFQCKTESTGETYLKSMES